MTKQVERQWPLYAMFEVAHAAFSGTDPLELGTIPAGAVVVGSFRETAEGFDASAVSIDGGGLFTLAPAAAGSTGRTAGTAPGMATVPTVITATRDSVADVTGKAYVCVEYVFPHKQNEIQP